MICNVNEWDTGTNWQFHQTVNIYQNGTLCKLTQSLYWWLQSTGGNEMPVCRKQFLVRPVNVYFFTTVIWEQRRTRCESVWFVCPCLNECVQWGVWGLVVPHHSVCWPRHNVIAGWFCSALKSVLLLSCCFYAWASSRSNRFWQLGRQCGQRERRNAPFIWCWVLKAWE